MIRSLNEYSLSKHRRFSRFILTVSLALYFVMIVFVTPSLKLHASTFFGGASPEWVNGAISTITGAGTIVGFYSLAMWLYEKSLWKYFTPEIDIAGNWNARFTFIEGNRNQPLDGEVRFVQSWDGSIVGYYGYERDVASNRWKNNGKYKHVVIQAGGGPTTMALIFETRHDEDGAVADSRLHTASGVEFVEAVDAPGRPPSRFEGRFWHFQREEGLPPRRGFTTLERKTS